ncbi:MAG: extracellular solute-binding protein, partial [Candidatus Limnocylindria bacterium]
MLFVTACGGEATPSDSAGDGGDGSGGGGDGPLVFWTAEDNAERVAAQQAIVDRFTEETDIEVDLVAITEGDLQTQITAAIAGDTLPDVFGAMSLGFTHQLAADGLVNTDANAAVVEALGRDTFSQSALDLVTVDDALIGVPSDSFAQLLVYRT